ncbi:MAG: 50S ribosomal protein L15 [Phycisphaerales bacterium]
MMINDITALAGANKKRKRVGRGEGSGHGKQSGRGNKGAGSRSGTSAKKAFEGGQMPYFRRLAKFGFTNAQFKVQFWSVNLVDIVSHPMFSSGGSVNPETLIKAGLVRDTSRDLKILGHLGKAKALTVKLDVDASRVTGPARKAIETAGGKVNETGTRRDKVRGIDRNSEDRSPKNLTKKLKRGSKAKVVAPPPAPAADETAAKPAKGGKAKGGEAKGGEAKGGEAKA